MGKESFCCFLSGDFCSDKERDYQLLSHERYDRRYPARCRTNLDVDLIRNDLSIVASHVRVERYRYIDVLQTNRGPILQTSSEICGELPEDYKRQLGDILFSMLPAGSITGAPKKKTMQIIREAEGYERGFYTGITGYFDGDNMDSAVMIRFVEQEADGMYFKSGGGITFKSDAHSEYEEMKQKIYVPIY